jgi:hypothetical protein
VAVGSGVLVALLAGAAPTIGAEDAGITIVGETPGEPSPIERQFEAAARRALGKRIAEACVDGVCPSVHIRVSERERDYDIATEVAWPDGRTRATSSRCTICTPREAGMRAATEALALLDAAPPVRSTLVITSSPSGAAVEVDGEAVGPTPARIELEPGVHDIVVRKSGHVTQTRRVDLEGGEGDVTARFELARNPLLSPRAMKIAGWSLVGIGVAAMATGIGLVVLDENPVKNDCSGVHVDRFGNCEFRWNSLGAGVGVLVPGVLATAAGATLVVLDARRRRTPGGRRARVGVGFARVDLTLRF